MGDLRQQLQIFDRLKSVCVQQSRFLTPFHFVDEIISRTPLRPYCDDSLESAQKLRAVLVGEAICFYFS